MSFTIETISLSGTDVAPPQARSGKGRRVVTALEQAHRHVPGHQRLSILDNNLLKVERRNRRNATSVYLDLGFIEPLPKRYVHIPTRCIAVVLGAGGLFALLIWLNGFGLPGTTLHLLAALSAVALIGAGAGWLGWRRYCRRIVFRTRHGRVPVVQLVENQPGAREFRAFVDAIAAASDAALRQLPTEQQGFLAAELAEHRSLAEAGAISPENYHTAKRRILSCHGRPFSLVHAKERGDPAGTDIQAPSGA